MCLELPNCFVNDSSPFYIDISAIVSHLPTVKVSIRKHSNHTQIMVLCVVLIMSHSCTLYIYIYVRFYLFVLVAFSSESSLCIFTILFKIGCLAAVAYSATVNTVITIKM